MIFSAIQWRLPYCIEPKGALSKHNSYAVLEVSYAQLVAQGERKVQ
jgi:hypothetical protein